MAARGATLHPLHFAWRKRVEPILLYKPVVRRVSRLVLLLILALVSGGGTAPGEQASALPAKPNPAPTPIPLTAVPVEAQSAMTSLEEIDASLSRDQSSASDM